MNIGHRIARALTGLAAAASAGYVFSQATPLKDSSAAVPPRTIARLVSLLNPSSDTPAGETVTARRSSRKPPPETNRPAYIRYLLTRGSSARSLGEYESARRDFEQVLSLAEPGSQEELQAIVSVEEVYIDQGDLEGQRRARSLARARAGTSSGLLLWLLRREVVEAAFGGQLRHAQSFAESLESVYRELRAAHPASEFEPAWTVNYEYGRGVLAYYFGRYSESIASLRRALDARERLRSGLSSRDMLQAGGTVGQDGIQGRLAASLRASDQFVEAEIVARNAIELALKRFGARSTRTAGTVSKLADILFDQGRYAEAQTLAAIVLERYREASADRPSAHVATALGTLARALVFQSRWAEANDVYLERAELIRKNPDELRGVGASQLYWVPALARTKQTALAVKMGQQILRTYQRRYDSADYRIALSRSLLATALMRNGDRESAQREFKASIPVLLSRERAEESGEGTAAWRLRVTRWVLEDYLSLLVDAKSPEATEEAFRIADIARASGVQRALAAASSRAAISDPSLARLVRDEQDIGYRLKAMGEILANLLAEGTDPKVASAASDIRRYMELARQERSRLKSEIAARHKDYVQALEPKPLTQSEVGGLLGAGEAMVAIYAAETEHYVWAVSKDGKSAFARVPLSSSEAERMVAVLRRSLEPRDTALANWHAFDTQLAFRIYRELLGPVETAFVKAESLIIVPHGPLARLPFSLLVTASGQRAAAGALSFEHYRKVSWLIRKTAITQLPSVETLAMLQKPPPQAERLAFAGFGDPLFGGGVPPTSGVRGISIRNLDVGRVGPDGKPAASNELRNLARLPDTADEIRDIARTLGADPQRDIFLGVEASETRVKTTDLSKRRVIAFATHGLVPGDLNGLSQPALALSNPQLTGEKEADGLLSLDEVLALKLDADWVILSACNTAAAEGEGSEAISGLGRAFLYAGARALLVSNWPVETVSARQLTTSVFQRQTAAPRLSRAHALRAAMVDMIDRGTARGTDGKALFAYAHPLFWAPFSLVGDGR